MEEGEEGEEETRAEAGEEMRPRKRATNRKRKVKRSLRQRQRGQGRERMFNVTTAKYPPQDVLARVGVWQVVTGRRGQ